MGICIRISDRATHLFYGSLFDHYSSVPFVVNKVQVYLKQTLVDVVATGVVENMSTIENLMRPLRW